MGWVARFISFHKPKRPEALNDRDIELFLDDLSVNRNCSISTQKTAPNARVFLYRNLLQQEVTLKFTHANQLVRVPVLFAHNEALAVIEQLQDVYKLIAQILYGSV